MIERDSGRDVEVTLRDFQLLVAWENKATHQPDWQIEAGYVFGREIEYESNTPNIEPADILLLSAGLSF